MPQRPSGSLRAPLTPRPASAQSLGSGLPEQAVFNDRRSYTGCRSVESASSHAPGMSTVVREPVVLSTTERDTLCIMPGWRKWQTRPPCHAPDCVIGRMARGWPLGRAGSTPVPGTTQEQRKLTESRTYENSVNLLRYADLRPSGEGSFSEIWHARGMELRTGILTKSASLYRSLSC